MILKPLVKTSLLMLISAEFDAGDGVVGGIGLGYKFDDNFRIEGRLSYREGSFSETQFGTGTREGSRIHS
ncbi:hypothetical protein P4S73_26520 [Paraglaciecola sp. Hal342]